MTRSPIELSAGQLKKIQDRLLSRVHSKKLYLGCFSFQTLFNLGRRLESVCDATDEANGNEENKESGKTAEDDAR